MLLALFIHWEATGHPHYPSMEPGQRIAFISDTGAYKLKPLFIAGSVVSTVFLDLAFVSERWLRHTGKLARNNHTSQKILSVCSIIAALAGTAGLILLSIFDTYNYPLRHNGFLLLFLAGYIISAIFLCAEYQRLGIHYRQHRILRISFWVKLVFIIIEVLLAIPFGVLSSKGGTYENPAAIIEWVIALIFAFYVLSFVIDLLPSVRTKNHVPQGLKDRMREQEMGMHAPSDYGHPLTHDSAGPNQNGYPHSGGGAARNF